MKRHIPRPDKGQTYCRRRIRDMKLDVENPNCLQCLVRMRKVEGDEFMLWQGYPLVESSFNWERGCKGPVVEIKK